MPPEIKPCSADHCYKQRATNDVVYCWEHYAATFGWHKRDELWDRVNKGSAHYWREGEPDMDIDELPYSTGEY